MEYAGAQAQNSVRPTPELGKLKAAAERISRAANNVDNFLARFHGSEQPTSAGSGIASPPTTDGYRNDLEAVFSALDYLESAVSSLEHIG